MMSFGIDFAWKNLIFDVDNRSFWKCSKTFSIYFTKSSEKFCLALYHDSNKCYTYVDMGAGGGGGG